MNTNIDVFFMQATNEEDGLDSHLSYKISFLPRINQKLLRVRLVFSRFPQQLQTPEAF